MEWNAEEDVDDEQLLHALDDVERTMAQVDTTSNVNINTQSVFFCSFVSTDTCKVYKMTQLSSVALYRNNYSHNEYVYHRRVEKTQAV